METPTGDSWSQLLLAPPAPLQGPAHRSPPDLLGITDLRQARGTCAEPGRRCTSVCSPGQGPQKAPLPAMLLSLLQAQAREGTPPGVLHVQMSTVQVPTCHYVLQTKEALAPMVHFPADPMHSSGYFKNKN